MRQGRRPGRSSPWSGGGPARNQRGGRRAQQLQSRREESGDSAGESRSIWLGASVNEGCGGGGCRGSEELERRVRLGVTRVQGRPRTVREPLARQEVGGVGPARDVDDAVLELGKQVDPTSLVVADVALLL